jgi:cell division protein FtsW
MGQARAKNNSSASGTDPWLLVSVFVLMGLGLVMVLSSSAIRADRVFDREYYFFGRQCVYALLGTGVMYLAWRVPIALIYRLVYLWLLLALVLLLLTLTPAGTGTGGASRWLDLGVATLQPLEPAKVALVLYLAYFFSQKQDKIKTFSVGFLPPILVTLVFAGVLILQPDFGGAVFITALFFFMSLVGGTRLVYLFASGSLCAGAGALMLLNSPYRLARWTAFMEPFQNAQNVGYQLVQSLYGLGNGGLFGVGLGEGKQKLFFLPEAHTDFILSVVGEELGFVGLSLVFLFFGVFLFRSMNICLKQQDLQARFTVFGLSLIVLLEAFLNIAVVVGACPPTGMPMPFMSYGGSNLLVMCLSSGLILNIGSRRRT